MNRVSSRQRLVSWDAFDASAPDNDSMSSSSDDEVLSEYQTCVDEVAMMMVSPSSSWTSVGGEAMDSSPSVATTDPTTTIMTVGGHKRDRAARRCDNKLERSSSSSSSTTSALRSGVMTALGEASVPRTPTPLQFQDLAVDTQLHIMSFLDVSSLRAVMSTNRSHRSLLMSKDAHFLWKDWIQQLWPKLIGGGENIIIMDSMQLPTAAGHYEQHPNANIALLLSLAATRHSTFIDADLFQPSTISYHLRSLRRHPHRPPNPTNPPSSSSTSSPLFLMFDHRPDMTVVQFRGDVGVGDRCIRAKEPLARPQRRVAATASYHHYYNHHHNQNHQNRTTANHHNHPHYFPTPSNLFFLHGLPFHDHHYHDFLHHYNHPPAQPQHYQHQQQYQNHHHHPQQHQQQQLLPPFYPPLEPPTTTTHTRLSLLDMLCRGAKAVSVIDSHHPYSWHWKPFVTPHVVMNPTDDGKLLLDLTPRLVSYFEVSILSDADLKNPTSRSFSPSSSSATEAASAPAAQARHRSECVAVGVASHYFDVHSRMPGWDSFSFGYHGDDGGIFHASGAMLRPYGPCFGVGDTVGCGIDYTNGGIFFTLNAKFLGYAWTGISTSLYLQQELYPVVGMDTQAPISCNFGGQRPFVFDLSTFLQQHAHVIKDACCGLGNTTGSAAAMPMTDVASSSSSRLSSRRRGGGG